MRVSQINVDKDMKIIDLINQFDQSGVLGAGRVARACNILTDMINWRSFDSGRNEEYHNPDD